MTRIVLTDIEGTTSSIAFVKEVLFPYARAALPAFVAEHANDAEVRRWLDLVSQEAGTTDDAATVTTLQSWIDEDRKHTALKALQGKIWEAGYRQGDYQAHMHADAPAALKQWKADGHPLYVYSSGSVPAQKLFFGFSEAGDLTPLISGWFDTQIGNKREVQSYQNIVDAIGEPANHIVFLSDVVEELDAARDAGLITVLLDRLEDYPTPRIGEATNGHHRVTAFDHIDLNAL